MPSLAAKPPATLRATGCYGATPALLVVDDGTASTPPRALDSPPEHLSRHRADSRHGLLKIAVVMPVLDEESTIAETLPRLLEEAEQVIVSDGGSGDRTLEIAATLGARVVEGPPGRGRQLNRGAAAASGDVLLFVHADTTLPAGSIERVREAVRGGASGGGFFVEWRSERPIMRLGGRLTNLRTRLTRCPLGDQAQFCRADLFGELGGFRDWPILEDLDFARRLKRAGRVALLEPPVVVSARRYQSRGIARTVAINWLIWLLYFAGVSPERLAGLYRNVR